MKIMQRKTLFRRKLYPAALALTALAVAGLGAQAPAGAPAQATPAPQQPPREVIRRQIDVITTDVIVRDNRGQFVADLKKDEFEVYEDGVKQEVVSFVLTHGGRVYNQTLPAPPKPQAGIILPPARPTNDAAGRIFVIFVDDLHLDFRNTGRIRALFKQVAEELIHEGDMFAVVSSGPASIEIPLTYDRRRLDEALKKVTGGGMRPQDILDQPDGAQGPPELRYRAHTAMSTVYDILKSLGVGAQPAEGVHLHQQRLRLQSVRGQPAQGHERAVLPALVRRRRIGRDRREPLLDAGQPVRRGGPGGRAGRADAPGEPRQRDALHASIRAGSSADRISTRRST